MKQSFFARKTPSKIASTSAGCKGVAITPSARGIDVVDRELTEVIPKHDANHQPRALDARAVFGAPIQKYAAASGAESSASAIRQANNTGLPDNLKSGVENLSGLSMDDVKVHYNSTKPAQMQAFAYTQGVDIHVAPGRERHVPHEAWHVVQQKQGRVKPTMQAKGVAINDDDGLEREADVMGKRAAQTNQPQRSFKFTAVDSFQNKT